MIPLFCRNCGTQMDDNAAFCPNCGAPSTSKANVGAMPPHDGGNDGGVANIDAARNYLTRGIIAVAGIILGALAIQVLMKLVTTLESVITTFSSLDAIASGIGIAGYVVCGLLLAGCAALAVFPLVRCVIEENALGKSAVDRSIAFSVAFIVLIVATWICKLIFHSPAGGDMSRVLYTIFSTFGEAATGALVPTIIALAILYVIRTKLVGNK